MRENLINSIMKIKQIANSPFRAYKLKNFKHAYNTITDNIYNTIKTFFSPFFNSAINKLKVQVLINKISRVIEQVNSYNKNKVFNMLKDHLTLHKKTIMNNKRHHLLMISLIRAKYARVKSLVSAITVWKLNTNYKQFDTYTLLSDFCKTILECKNSNNPWTQLYNVVNEFFTKNTRAIHTDLLKLDSDKRCLLKMIEGEPNKIQLNEKSITQSCIKSEKVVESHNIFTDPLFNKAVDLPLFDYHTPVLGLRCIPILSNNIIGVIRVYTKSPKQSHILYKSVSHCLSTLLLEVEKRVYKVLKIREDISNKEKEQELYNNELNNKRIIRHILKQMLITQNPLLLKSDDCKLLMLNKDTLVNVGSNEEVREKSKCYEIIKARKINEHDMELYIPIVLEDIEGLLIIKKDYHVIIDSYDLKSIGTTRLLQAQQMLTMNESYKETINAYKKANAMNKLFKKIQSRYLSSVYHFFISNGKYATLQCPHLKIQHTRLPLIINVLKINMRKSFKVIIKNVQAKYIKLLMLKRIYKATAKSHKISILRAWNLYRERIEQTNFPIKINTMTYKSKDHREINILVIPSLGENTSVRRMQFNAIRIITNIAKHKIAAFLIRRINLKNTYKKKKLLKQILIALRIKMLSITFSIYKNSIISINKKMMKILNGFRILYNKFTLYKTKRIGKALNHWRKLLISELQHKITQSQKQILITQQQTEQPLEILKYVDKIMDTHCDTLEELMNTQEFSKLTKSIVQYYSNQFSAHICLFSFLLPTNEKYHVCGLKSNQLISKDDKIISLLKSNLKTFVFSAPIKDYSMSLSLRARGLHNVKSGAIFPIKVLSTLLGTLELYRNDKVLFVEEEVNEKDLMIIKKLLVTVNTVLSTRSLKKELGAARNKLNLRVDSLAICWVRANSFTSMLRKMSEAANNLLDSNKALIILIQNESGYFYSVSDSFMYKFDIKGTFVESIIHSGRPMSLNNKAKVQSITEETHAFIQYIPIRNKGKVIAICELCYNSFKDAHKDELLYSNAIRYELVNFSRKITKFLKVITNAMKIKERTRNKLLLWKNNVAIIKNIKKNRVEKERRLSAENKLSEVFNITKEYETTISFQEEKLKNLKLTLDEHKEKTEILKEEKEKLEIEKAAKLKFLAAALLFNQMEEYSAKTSKLRTHWQTWFNTLFCYKVIEATRDENRKLIKSHKKIEQQTATKMLIRIHLKSTRKRKEQAFNKLLFNSIR